MLPNPTTHTYKLVPSLAAKMYMTPMYLPSCPSPPNRERGIVKRETRNRTRSNSLVVSFQYSCSCERGQGFLACEMDRWGGGDAVGSRHRSTNIAMCF